MRGQEDTSQRQESKRRRRRLEHSLMEDDWGEDHHNGRRQEESKEHQDQDGQDDREQGINVVGAEEPCSSIPITKTLQANQPPSILEKGEGVAGVVG